MSVSSHFGDASMSNNPFYNHQQSNWFVFDRTADSRTFYRRIRRPNVLVPAIRLRCTLFRWWLACQRPSRRHNATSRRRYAPPHITGSRKGMDGHG
jgi:hypothetical protein